MNTRLVFSFIAFHISLVPDALIASVLVHGLLCDNMSIVVYVFHVGVLWLGVTIVLMHLSFTMHYTGVPQRSRVPSLKQI